MVGVWSWGTLSPDWCQGGNRVRIWLSMKRKYAAMLRLITQRFIGQSRLFYAPFSE